MEKRNTIQKQLIMEAVNELKSHPSSEEIYEFLRLNHPTISRGTVFRNLKQMAESGEIRRVEVPNAADRFDFNTKEHYHMSCRCCGRVYDVEIDYLEDIVSKINTVNGFIIDEHDVIFKGICARCNHNKKN